MKTYKLELTPAQVQILYCARNQIQVFGSYNEMTDLLFKIEELYKEIDNDIS